MKEIKTILHLYDTIDFQRQKAALVTVVRVEGSSYRRVGARMLVLDDGVWTGGISGGCLEGDALKRARLAIHQNKPSSVVYDTTRDDQYQIGVGLGCDGVIETLFTPVDPSALYNPMNLFRELIKKRTISVALTVLEAEGRAPVLTGQFLDLERFNAFEEVKNNPVLQNKLTDDLQQMADRKKSLIKAYPFPDGSVKLLLETITPPVRLILMGSNYDVFPLARSARALGWEVVVAMNARKSTKSILETADRVINPDEPLPADAFSAVILMAHDYATDLNNLEKALTAQVPYIGVLGPKKRWQKMAQGIEEKGNQLDRLGVFAPVGLDIGANTPEEIAISIIAEIIAFFSGRAGGFLKDRPEPIHSDE